MQSSKPVLASALAFSLAVPFLGYVYLGWLYAVILTIGYLGGFLLWIAVPSFASWESIRAPYWCTLLAFLVLHKTEENQAGFFDAVSSRITGVPVPEVSVALVVAMLIIPVGAWLAVPLLMSRGIEFGRFLAWTFFASMGITELAHFVCRYLRGSPTDISRAWRVFRSWPHWHGGAYGGCRGIK